MQYRTTLEQCRLWNYVRLHVLEGCTEIDSNQHIVPIGQRRRSYWKKCWSRSQHVPSPNAVPNKERGHWMFVMKAGMSQLRFPSSGWFLRSLRGPIVQEWLQRGFDVPIPLLCQRGMTERSSSSSASFIIFLFLVTTSLITSSTNHYHITVGIFITLIFLSRFEQWLQWWLLGLYGGFTAWL